MNTIVLILLVCKYSSGVLERERSSENLNTQTTGDQTLMLQGLVTTLSDKVHKLEKEAAQIKKDADLKIDTVEREMTSKLNKMSVRLGQMEQLNGNVSKQLQKEKNDRQHLEQLYAALERELKNSTTAAGKVMASIDLQFRINNLTNLLTDTMLNVANLDKQLENVSKENNALKNHIVNLTPQSDTLLNVTGEALKTTTQNHGPVGFTVYAPNQYTAFGDILKYSKLTYNSGNGYNMSTGIFTCVYSGLYFFTVTMYRSPGAWESYCYFYTKEGGTGAIVDSGTDNLAGFQSGSQSYVVTLNTGDQVYLSSCGGVDHMNDDSSFSGFLISS